MVDVVVYLLQIINYGVTGIITALCVYIIVITVLFYAILKKHHVGTYYSNDNYKQSS